LTTDTPSVNITYAYLLNQQVLAAVAAAHQCKASHLTYRVGKIAIH